MSGIAGDFDNDMDQDIFLACRGGVLNVADILLENDGNGVFHRSPERVARPGRSASRWASRLVSVRQW